MMKLDKIIVTYIGDIETQYKRTCQLPSTTCDDVKKEVQPALDTLASFFPIMPGGESLKSYIECKICDKELCNV